MQKSITGEGNTVTEGAEAVHSGLKLTIKGDANRVELGPESICRAMDIRVSGNGNQVILGRGVEVRGQILVKGNGQTIRIGDHSTMIEGYLLAQEGCDITIGRHCMFSRDIEIRTTDAHSVVEVATGKRINGPGSVVIGDHVWLGVGVLVSKGITIASDVVVGAQSGVFRNIEESGVVAAGAPAVVIRRGVTWNRKRKEEFTPAELNAWRNPADAE